MMVLDYYGLWEQPFGVTPDSRYLFLSGTHREATASLLYGVDEGCGFLALIAAPGLGKTTLLFHVLHQLREKARTVFLFQTVCTPLDLLRALLTGLGVQETQGSLIQMQSRLKEVLVEQARLGKRVVVVIDEAQNLDDSVLELVRMLSNFETAREKLIQIILSGQSQLAEKMAAPELEQLRQRVSIFSYLKPLSHKETELYIAHRLRMAGYTFGAPLFTRDALALIADYSDGIPRNINNLCFNSLALGCALQRKPIDRDVVLDVIDDLDFGRWRKKPTLNARPQTSEPRKAPSFSPAARARARFAGSLPKIALVLAVLVVVGVALLAIRSGPAEKFAAVHAESMSPPQVTAAPPAAQSAPPAEDAVPMESMDPQPSSASLSSLSAGQAPEQTDSANTVSVMPGETLFEICVASFGSCNPDLLQKFRRLNPGLSNLDHIEAGQKIRLPVLEADTDKLVEASSGEKNTP
jgi:general secretion pathway protein A